MMFAKKASFIAPAAFVGIAAVSFVVAVNATSDETRQIAVFAALVTILKAGYDIWEKERARERDELNKADEDTKKGEQVATCVIFKKLHIKNDHRPPRVTLGLTIHNACSKPIGIASVWVEYESEGSPFKAHMFTSDPQAMATSRFPKMNHASEVKIEPGDTYVFFMLDPSGAFEGHRLLTIPADKLFIKVQSQLGIIATVSGAEIHEAIKSRNPANDR